ncbi:hypothetical protein [Nocardia sp. BMG51109]|uniref:hypothetical protein n=1 Tax=Nocardia sp. BMG51109 TaxID=1056816 RepID=UPI0004B498C4|nr:hypothetical protein [Nocardia sp. BMG51109]
MEALMEPTVVRARELQHIHRFHPPDACVVHVEAACFLLLHEEGGQLVARPG